MKVMNAVVSRELRKFILTVLVAFAGAIASNAHCQLTGIPEAAVTSPASGTQYVGNIGFTVPISCTARHSARVLGFLADFQIDYAYLFTAYVGCGISGYTTFVPQSATLGYSVHADGSQTKISKPTSNSGNVTVFDGVTDVQVYANTYLIDWDVSVVVIERSTNPHITITTYGEG